MKILIALEDPVAARRLEAILQKWKYEVVVSGDGAEASRALQANCAPRLGILDRIMPGMDGTQVCREVRNRTDPLNVYILLLTRQGQKQDIAEAMKAGADDHLPQPFDEDELKMRLGAGRRIVKLQDELQSAQKSIAYQVTHDTLTGLLTRGAIINTLQQELARVRRLGTPVSVIMTELDHFKEINEAYGHMAGDAVLREAARRIRSWVRPYDTIGRYGGSQFLIIVPGCDAQNALNQAERLRTRISGEGMDVSEWGKFTAADKGTVQVTFSLGVALGDKTYGSESLIRAAELALARAKNEGRNRVELGTIHPS